MVKILQIKNTEEYIKYDLPAEDDTLNQLNNLFPVYDNIEDYELSEGKNHIESLTKDGDYTIHLASESIPILIVISKQTIHLIALKREGIEKIISKISDKTE